MAVQVKIRRGSSEEHETFVGVLGEVTYDTTLKTLRAHDGVTEGGFIMKTEGQGPDVALASPLPLDDSGGSYVVVTGSGTVSAVTLSEGRTMTVRFSGATILEDDGVSLLLPGSVDHYVGAGDLVVFQGEASDVVRVLDVIRAVGDRIFPGMFAATGGASVRPGWLFCYGQNISRTTYAALFNEIGTTWGVGDGSTTFTLPDLRGRVIAGKDDMGGVSANRLTGLSGGVNGDTLAAYGGAESHSLSSGENASHTHTVDMGAAVTTSTETGDHTHTWSDTSSTQSASHTHSFTYGERRKAGDGLEVSDNTFTGLTETTGNQSASHTHAVSGTTSGKSATHTHTVDIPAFSSASSGSGNAHNNVQPTAIANVMIFTGVL